MASVQPRLYIRLGTHAEKEYLEKTIKYLDGFLVAANLIEATPGATASLIVKLSGAKVDKSYFIDPMTYAYGLDVDFLKSEQIVKIKGKKTTQRVVKRSYRQLSEQFGGVFAKVIERDEPITPDDFAKASVVNATCKAVVEFQLGRPGAELASDEEFAPYADSLPSPAAVLTPYFYIDEDNLDEWLDLVFKFAKATVALDVEPPVHAVVCADESILEDSDVTDALVEKLPETGVDGVWFWLSNFDEHSATTQQLRNLKDLVAGLSKSIEVYNMHGGYYSLALSRLGMTGTAHGIGYGEQKVIEPVQGQGIPTVRYYLRDVRKRLGVPEIERAFGKLGIRTKKDFFDKICDCVICRGAIKTGLQEFSSFGELHYAAKDSKRKSQTAAAAKLCRFHFLLNRIKERDAIAEQTVEEICESIADARRIWSKQPSVEGDTKHLLKWQRALAEQDEDDE
jgi:hypothetical protein